jgi:hypothetical protein
MKNKILFVMLAVALVFGMTLAGCKDSDDGAKANTDPKTIVITGISASDKTDYFPTAGALALYSAGTTVAQIIANPTANVAGASFTNSDITISASDPYTYTIPLYNPGTGNGRWTGNGTFEVLVSDGVTNPATAKVKKATITFTDATTTVAWGSFVIPSM